MTSPSPSTPLPDHLADVVEQHARRYLAAEVGDKWPAYEAAKAKFWMASDSQAEFDAAHAEYRKMTGI